MFLTVYLANAGHGFLLDDYDWVLHSRVRRLADIGPALGAWSGFFRPVVAATFTVNEWMTGARPFGFAIGNIALALACAWAVSSLVRGFNLSWGASALAAFLWLMNLYFTRMAVMWISGRTALVVTICAAVSAGWVMRGRLLPGAIFLVLALFAKEEAVLLPVAVSIWIVLARRITGTAPVPLGRWIGVSIAALALYLAVRNLTPALTPMNAPDYYRFTFDAGVVLRNIGEYADRSSTLAVGISLLAIILLGWSRPFAASRTRFAVSCGVAWTVVSLGLAYFLPVRSDLYAAVAGVGASLAAAAVIDPLWAHAPAVRRRRALIAAVLLPVLMFPVYWQRTQRLARQARFASTTLVDLESLTRDLSDGARVRIDDAVPEIGTRVPTMAGGFGAQLSAAYELRTGRRLDLVLTSDIPDEARDADAARAVRILAVIDGRLQRVR